MTVDDSPLTWREPPRWRLDHLRHLLRLALADIRRDGLLSSCSILMLAASLAPLLTLFGLENGVIGTLIARQDQDPAMRLIVPEVTGGHRFDRAWFETTASWPDVAFVLPSTRAIAGLIDLVALPREPSSARAAATPVSPSASATSPTDAMTAPPAGIPVRISLLPSAQGDPVTAGYTVDVAANSTTGAPIDRRANQVVLSASAARKLAVGPGDRVNAVIERIRDGQTEPALTPLVVSGVLPIERQAGDVGFAALALVEAIQAYRDGHSVESLGWSGDAPAAAIDQHPLFRLYARSIRDVAALAARLQTQGISVFTRDSEIAATLGLQRNLVAVLWIVSGLAALGFTVAMVALQIATVRRKRREYAILQLIGYGRRWLAALPCAESLALSLAAITLAFAMYALAACVIDLYFAEHLAHGESACRLSIKQAGWLCGMAVAVSLIPAVVAGISASGIDPGDELRDV